MDRYSEKKSKQPIFVTGMLTAVAMFVLYYLFLKGPEVEQIQKVRGRSR